MYPPWPWASPPQTPVVFIPSDGSKKTFSVEDFEKFQKFIERQERKKARKADEESKKKKEEEEKKKKTEKKPTFSPVQVAVMLTVFSPAVGLGYLWAFYSLIESISK